MKKFIITLFILLLATTVFAADSVQLGAYQVDLVRTEANQDGTHTFTYAVTGSRDYVPFADLSHWVLDTCVGYLVSPQPGPYTSPFLTPECGTIYGDCETPTSMVEIGGDPTTGLYGIKFDSPHPDIGRGDTGIFQITVTDFRSMGLVDVGVKYSQHVFTGQVDGPICGSPTAVTLAYMDGSAEDNAAGIYVALFTLVLLTVGLAIYNYTRRK